MERFWNKLKTTLGFAPSVPSEPDEPSVSEEAQPTQADEIPVHVSMPSPEPPVLVALEERILNASRYSFGGRSCRLMGPPYLQCNATGVLNANRYHWVSFKTGILNADRFSWQGPHNRVLNGVRYTWKIVEI
jgi:hypothetical protein